MLPLDGLLALVANLAWGFNFIAGKVGTAHFQPLLFTALRFSVLLCLLCPFLSAPRALWWPLAQIGLVMGLWHFSCVFVGLHLGGDVASVAIAGQLYVPFSALLAWRLLGEQVSARRWLGIAVSLGGVLVTGFDPVVFQHLDSLFFITLAAVGLAYATILMRRSPGLGVFRLQAWIALVATPGLFLLSWLFEDGQWQAMRSATWQAYWSPLYSAVGASIIGHGIVYHLLTRYPVSIITPLMLLAPVIAVCFGILILNDQPTWKLVLGGILTLLGVLVITLRPVTKA